MVDSTRKVVEQFVYCLFRGQPMMPILYYLPPSPPCRAVLLLGRMLEIDFDLRAINVLEGDNMKPDFIQLNPQHCIPTLDDHELVLWESRVILTYLTAAYGKDDNLYPKDFRIRAMVDQRLQFDLGTLMKRTLDYFFPTIIMGAPLEESKKAKLAEALYWFESMMKNRVYAAATHFTLADLAICVTVSQIDAFGFDLLPYPRVRTWYQRCVTDLEPFGYEEINQSGADTLAGLFRSKLQQ